jgi:secreted PhoX family phosphatase
MGGRDEADKYIVRSDGGVGDTFDQIVEQRLSRRDFLKTAAVSSAMLIATTAGAETAAA